MEVDRPDLDAAAAEGLVAADKAQALWDFLAARRADRPAVPSPVPVSAPQQATPASHAEAPRFRFTHVLYYLGGMIAIGAMSLFLTLGWEQLGPWGMLAIVLAYAAALGWLTGRLLPRWPIPAGIMATLIVVLTPLAVYAVQTGLGLWPDDGPVRDYHRIIDWRWLLMEGATLAVGAALLWRWRLPFLVLPVAVTLWYLSMDIVPMLVLQAQGALLEEGASPEALDAAWEARWQLAKTISLLFGLGMVALAFWIDLRTRRSPDFGFWLYVFGTLAFWGALTAMDSDSEWARLGYAGINVAMILLGAILGRRVFAIFGGLGLAFYLGDLAMRVFADSLLFPLALSAIGLAIVGLGILWQRQEARLTDRLRAPLPAALRELLARAD